MSKKTGAIIIIIVVILGAGILVYRNGWPGRLGAGLWQGGRTASTPTSTVLTEIPDSLPKDLLPEPVAPTLIQTKKITNTTEEIKVEYASLNAASNVVKLYQQVLSAKGWNVTVVRQDTRSAELKVTKGQETAGFYLVQTETSGTQVTIIYTHQIK